MQITILDFIPNPKNNRIGYIDFKIVYNEEKFEIFRNCSYFIKENKKWVSLPMTERKGKWVPTYERNPQMNEMFKSLIKVIDDYFLANPTFLPKEENLFNL